MNPSLVIGLAIAAFLVSFTVSWIWLRRRYRIAEDSPIKWRVSVVQPFGSVEWAWVYRKGDYAICADGYGNREDALMAALVYAECMKIEEGM